MRSVIVGHINTCDCAPAIFTAFAAGAASSRASCPSSNLPSVQPCFSQPQALPSARSGLHPRQVCCLGTNSSSPFCDCTCHRPQHYFVGVSSSGWGMIADRSRAVRRDCSFYAECGRGTHRLGIRRVGCSTYGFWFGTLNELVVAGLDVIRVIVVKMPGWICCLWSRGESNCLYLSIQKRGV